jgi:translocation and assembly module TamA
MILPVRAVRSAPLLLLALAAGCASEPEQGKPSEERVVFKGSESKSDGELRELVRHDLRRYEAEQRPTALEDAAYRIEYQYRLEGFDRVVVRVAPVGAQIVFTIEEGPKIRLGRVRFEGATVYKDEELHELVPGRFFGDAPPYSLRLLLLIEESVVASYRSRGYADVAVQRRVSPEPDENSRIDVWFAIDEGKPYFVTEIRGLPAEGGLLLKTGEFVGRPFTPVTTEALEATVVDYYRDHGHPFATARTRTLPDRDTGSVVVEADVRPGQSVRLSGVEIKGAVWTRGSFIENRVAIAEDAEYRASELRKAEERLVATNAFKRVRVSPGRFQEGTGKVPVEVEVEEREAGEASVRGGYGSFEGLRIGADLTGVNIWGGAESIRIGGFISSAGYRGDSELGVPYLFGSELRLGISAYYESREYPSYDAFSRGGVLAFSYPILPTLSAATGIRYANIVTSNVDPSVPPGDLLDFNYTAVFLSPTLDLRDSAVMPTRGMLLTSEVSWSPSTLLSEVEFWSASGRFSYFFPFPEGIVFATSFQGGMIVPIGDTEEIPISLRNFAGGTNTVRGYKFESVGPKVNGEPTGGEVFLALQSEVRFPLWGSLQGAVFADVGGVWFDRTEVTFDDLRYAVGIGLRFVTAAGALVADLGWNPHTLDGEHPFEFHLSVGFPF